MQDAGETQAGVQEIRYVTVPVAAKLAGCPESYIEHLCKDDYLPHAFSKSGGFLPRVDALFSVLHIDESKKSEVELVDPSLVTTNPNGLPAHWQAVTAQDPSLHHEEAPLFPPLQKRELPSGAALLPLLSTDEGEMLEDATASELLPDAQIAPLLPSGVVEDILESGTAPDEFLLEEGEGESLVDTVPPVDSNPAVQEDPVEPVVAEQAAEPIDDIIEVAPPAQEDNQQEEIAVVEEEASSPDSSPEILPEVIPQTEIQYPKSDIVKVETLTPRNPRPIVAAKIVPVPHVPISQTIPSAHPLALAPSVVPFSTSAPAAHTKVAAVYTQPTARAVEWLPWMRTSLWPKRRVAKATAHGAITNEHSGFPAIPEEGNRTAVDVRPVAPSRVESIQTPKVSAPVVTFEAPASSINMEPEPVVPLQTSRPIQPYIEPKINDSLDSAFFEGFTTPPAPVQVIEEPVRDVFAEALTDTKNIEQKSPVENSRPENAKPEINDSWDAAFFSKN